MPVEIVAETGSTFEGRYELLERLIDQAAAAGADVLKTQWVSNAERLCERRHAPEYLESYRKLQFPPAWHEKLRLRCDQAGIRYACSIYLPEDAAVVVPFVAFTKISSFEAMNSEIWDAVIGRVVASTGLMTADERFSLARWGPLKQAVRSVTHLRVLVCTSSYPCPLEDLNLALLRDESLCLDGLSDHSADVYTPLVAVGAGARMLEAHIRLADTDARNADYAVSLDPRSFELYVRHARLAEIMCGDGTVGVRPSEVPMLKYRVGA